MKLVIGALLTVAALAVPRSIVAQDQKPVLTGRWTYNDTLSDRARDVLQSDSTGERRGRRGGGGGGMGGGIGGRGGRGGGRGGFGGGGGGMDEGERTGTRATLDLAIMHPIVMDIAQADTALTFTSDGEPPVVLPVSGHKVKVRLSDEVEIENKGKWQGFHFVIEREVSHGGKVTEEYLKSTDGKQLYVIVKVEGLRGREVQFRRIYDATPGS